jgi:hypothetical protein
MSNLTADKIKAVGREKRMIDQKAIYDAISYFEALLERLGNGGADNLVCATALAALRECAERRENKPLTVEQLRARFGRPVWIVQGNEAHPQETETNLVELFQEERGYIMFWFFGYEVEEGLLIEHYGKTWLAYDHEPERSDT